MIREFIKRQPWRTIAAILAVWIVLAAVNIALHSLGLDIDTPQSSFPISEYWGPTFHWSGLLFALPFIVVLWMATRLAAHLRAWHVWLIGLVLIVLGNLTQGTLETAFLHPLVGGNNQYYHDAIKISSADEFLRTFNVTQSSLLVHSRSHPPFAVLIHYLLMGGSMRNVHLLALGLVLAASFMIPCAWYLLHAIGASRESCTLLTLLLAVLPAFNIYAAVSLDAVIAASCTLALFGLAGYALTGKRRYCLAFCFGGLAFNALSFGGGFLLAVSGLLALRDILRRQRCHYLAYTLVLAGLLVILTVLAKTVWGYDHVVALLTASRLENPHGFRAFAAPVEYLMTRIENVGELGVFLSIGVLAIVFADRKLQRALISWQDAVSAVTAAGLISLLAMFLAGAFRTGETARACLFIYPFVILTFRDLDRTRLHDLITWAGAQTVTMQLCGSYFW